MSNKNEISSDQIKEQSVSRPLNGVVRRTMKFRAWDRENKKMYEDEIESIYLSGNGRPACVGLSNFTTNLICIGEDRQLDVLQFTGLKDKYGNEIFEGDIITFEQEGSFIVKWDKNNAAFTLVETNGDYGGTFRYHNDYSIEVIGNIFENPELLDKYA